MSSMQKFWLEGIGLWGAPSSFSNTASLVCRFAAGCSNIGGKRAAMKKKGLWAMGAVADIIVPRLNISSSGPADATRREHDCTVQGTMPERAAPRLPAQGP